MTNLNDQPNRIPLILILIGTTILAIPGAFGTYILAGASPGDGFIFDNVIVKVLLTVAIAGFVLFAGYIQSAVSRSYNSTFWLCSMIYNLGLSVVYWAFLFYALFSSPQSFLDDAKSSLILLVPAWTVFVTGASGYYYRFALSVKKSEYL
jgi:hypothetical protein